MLRVLEDAQEIAEAQETLVAAIANLATESGRTAFGFQYGQLNSVCHYIAGLDLWMGHSKWPHCYWNAFGFGPVLHRGTIGIEVDINSPLSGIDRRLSGVILCDDGGSNYLGHRGRIGGGLPGVSKAAFLKRYPERTREVADGDRKTPIFVVAELSDAHLAAKIAHFARLVSNFRIDLRQDRARHRTRTTRVGSFAASASLTK